MTREQMIKTNWKPYMKLEFKTSSMENPIICILLAINFESEILTILPVDTETYEPDEVFMPIQYIFIPQPRKVKQTIFIHYK